MKKISLNRLIGLSSLSITFLVGGAPFADSKEVLIPSFEGKISYADPEDAQGTYTIRLYWMCFEYQYSDQVLCDPNEGVTIGPEIIVEKGGKYTFPELALRTENENGHFILFASFNSKKISEPFVVFGQSALIAHYGGMHRMPSLDLVQRFFRDLTLTKLETNRRTFPINLVGDYLPYPLLLNELDEYYEVEFFPPHENLLEISYLTTIKNGPGRWLIQHMRRRIRGEWKDGELHFPDTHWLIPNFRSTSFEMSLRSDVHFLVHEYSDEDLEVAKTRTTRENDIDLDRSRPTFTLPDNFLSWEIDLDETTEN